MAAAKTKQGIPLIEPVLNWFIGSRNERFVKKYTMRVNAINALEAQTRLLTDQQIKDKFKEFRGRLDKGESAIDLMIEAFAVAREGMDRSVGIRNIFNPAYAFDPSTLPAGVQEAYHRTKAEMDARPVLIPATYQPAQNAPAPPPEAVPDTENEFRGCTDLIPGWMQGEIPVEIYNAVREMMPESRPPFRARPFDVQLIGAMVLYQGKIAEMKTGEGKTIVAPLATYLAAIEGLKVHVVTVNDYLVQRDRDWTYPFFHALGLTVGAIHPTHMQPEDSKRLMYQTDVVYGTTSEFGFDYLRDNMKNSEDRQVQKGRQFAIVDEVDSILIDEARTPLIISGPAHEDSPRYDLANKLALHLVEKQKPWQAADDAVQECKKLIKGLEGDIRTAREKGLVPALEERLRAAKQELPRLEAARAAHKQFYEVELERKSVHLNHQGIAEAQRTAGVGSFYVGKNMDLPHLLEQSLRAQVVYQRDRDYIVAPTQNPETGRMEPSIVIVDTFTGRPMIGRQWSDGLHQACEAKEGVPVRNETQTVATVTIQNFFKMYKRLAGMTGTADTEAQEFHDIYHLDVVAIPTNKPVIRRDFDDLMFLLERDKWDAIVDEIKAFHDIGRPVLVGTTSVQRSEMLSEMLTRKHSVKHEVLNAKQHEREAHIVENAGQLGAVMIATNMAGRGTDIKLGRSSREALLNHWLLRELCSRSLTVEATDEQVRENVYRKVASRHLDIPKREAEELPFAELELRLLRHWAMKNTWVSPRKIESMGAEDLRRALDETGRFLLHRVRWFDNIEDMGGLHVIGTERHESRRIDNQLRGRCGRQGDNGSSRFFVSLEDPLMQMFAGDTQMKLLSKMGMKEGDAIEHPWLTKSVERAQRKVEERNFQVRKNILEYDEIMEHQRRTFYGLRQRAVEGRDLRGLIFGYIADAIDDAVALYLGPLHAAECAAEYARQVLDYPLQAERLRGRDADDLAKRIRQDAKDEARSMISVTIGEYISHGESDPTGPDSGVDFDAAGLCEWARTHFGLELNPDEIQVAGPSGRREVENRILQAAEERIDAADLSGVAKFTDKNFGANELIRWVENKFDIRMTLDEIAKAVEAGAHDAVSEQILKHAEALYEKREIEYPVEFTMSMAMAMMRQNPMMAAEQMVQWANDRYQLGWSVETLRTTPPQKAREELQEASRRFVLEGKLQKAIDEALACPDRESLAAHFRDRYKVKLPETVLRKEGEEHEHAVRARVEAVLRSELVYFERTMLLDTLDPIWKDHLYAMDQLRDTINYRAFSQQDPRIEFKREGSKLFTEMLEQVRERITDHVFKLRLVPQIGPPAPRPGGADLYAPPAGAPRPAAPRPAGPAPAGGGDPYYSPPAGAPRAAPAAAGAASSSPPPARPAPVATADKKLGRNDPCPQGSGRKYKKCCNRPDGTCDGRGLNAPADDSPDEN